MVEAADPGQPSEAGRLAQKSADAFAAGELEKAQRLAGDAALASAYTHLQQIVGVMAILLAPVLFVGNWALTGNELESSISAYYHTAMRDFFVAGLSVIANIGFLSAYPLWSAVVIGIDICVILALTVHGTEFAERG